MAVSLPLTARLGPRPDVLSRELDGEAVLLDLASGSYFSLNPTGRRIFELLDGERTLAEILDLLEAEFEAPREALESDLLALVTELAASGLVTEEAGRGSTGGGPGGDSARGQSL